jgi:hypothetical protein
LTKFFYTATWAFSAGGCDGGVFKWAPRKHHYRFKKPPILTQNELRFFNQLRHAVPDYYIFRQISMGHFLLRIITVQIGATFTRSGASRSDPDKDRTTLQL